MQQAETTRACRPRPCCCVPMKMNADKLIGGLSECLDAIFGLVSSILLLSRLHNIKCIRVTTPPHLWQAWVLQLICIRSQHILLPVLLLLCISTCCYLLLVLLLLVVAILRASQLQQVPQLLTLLGDTDPAALAVSSQPLAVCLS
jgi:hypothetical protein